MKGFTLLEMLIAVGITAILGTVAITAYIGYQRSATTIDALGTVDVLEEQLAVLLTTHEGTLHVCDNSMAHDGLANPYMDLSVVPMAHNNGFGAGLGVVAQIDKHGAAGVRAANVLHEEMVASNRVVEVDVIGEALTSFRILLTAQDQPFCDGSLAAAVPAHAPAQPVAQPAAANSQPAWAQAPPAAVATSAPSSQANPDELPTCPGGQELTVTFVNGAASQVCTTACAKTEVLKSDGTCVATNLPEPMCAGVCADVYLGNCAQDFPGMCDVLPEIPQICPKTCGVCSADNPPMMKCSDMAMIKGSTPEAPTMQSWTPKFQGVLPQRMSESTFMDPADIIGAMGVTSPDGTSPIQISKIEFPMGGRGITVGQDPDGRWRFTVPPGHLGAEAYSAKITLDNGHGTTQVSVVMTAW